MRGGRSASPPLQAPADRAKPPVQRVCPGLPRAAWRFSVFPFLKQRASRGVLDCSFLAGLSEGRGQRRPCLWLALREVDSQPVREILKWPLALRPESWAIAAHRAAQGRPAQHWKSSHTKGRKREREKERREELARLRGPGLLSRISCPARPD